MAKAMWIAVLTYFGLIAIAPPARSIEPDLNWVDVNAADWSEPEIPWWDNGIDTMSDEEWDIHWHCEKYIEAECEFDRLFAAVEFKVARNGRSMTKSTLGGGFKFAPASK